MALEGANFITPIQPLELGVDKITAKSGASESVSSLFKDIFTNAIGNAEEAERELEDKEYLLTTGQIDDAHTVPIASAEAQLSIDLLVAIRNKAVDAYNELMRISL